VAARGEIKLPDGRLVSVDAARAEERELAALRLERKIASARRVFRSPRMPGDPNTSRTPLRVLGFPAVVGSLALWL
jgi:hypothetical protein